MRGNERNTVNHQVASRAAELDRRSWHNWVLVVVVVVAATTGLGIANVMKRGGAPWPWSSTEPVLLAGLVALIVIFAAYLTWQQRSIIALRRQIEHNRDENASRIRKHYERLLAVYTVSQTLASQTKPQAIFDRMAQICFDTFSCEQVSLMLLDPGRHELEVKSAVGHLEGPGIIGKRLPLGDGVAGWVAQHQEPIVLGPDMDPAQFRRFTVKQVRPSWSMVVPIVVRDELVGVLSVSSRSPETSYDDEDLQALLVFAETTGICIRHTEQIEWMRQTNRTLETALRECEQKGQTKAA